MSLKVITGTIWEDGGATLLARIIGWDGNNLTQASLTSIAYSITNMNSNAQVVAPTALAVATVIYDTLQTTAIWTEDTTGFNFKHHIASTVFADGFSKYAVEYIFDPAAAGESNFVVQAILTTKALYSQ